MKKNKALRIILPAVILMLVSGFIIMKFFIYNPKCPTDLNRDGVTDNQDLLVFNASYNTECNTFFRKCPTDFNRDGKTDAADLGILISMTGKFCE